MRRREHLGRIYAVQPNGLPTTQGNPVQAVSRPPGEPLAILLDAPERQRRQGAVNALMVIGWDNAANDVLYADGYGCDLDLEILVNALKIAMGRPGRSPAERGRFAAAIREIVEIMGVAS